MITSSSYHPAWPYLGVVVIVETDVCECPEEEDHDCERDGLTDGAEHHAQVVVEDEGTEELHNGGGGTKQKYMAL